MESLKWQNSQMANLSWIFYMDGPSLAFEARGGEEITFFEEN